MPGACVSARAASLLGALVVSVVTVGVAAGVAAGANPPTSAYMQPYPKPVSDAAAEAFVDDVAPGLRSYSAEELARGIVVVPVPASSRKAKSQDGQVAVRPSSDDSVSSEGRKPTPAAVAGTELLRRAGVGTTGGGPDALWLSLLAAALAVAGLAVRFLVRRRPTSSTTG